MRRDGRLDRSRIDSSGGRWIVFQFLAHISQNQASGLSDHASSRFFSQRQQARSAEQLDNGRNFAQTRGWVAFALHFRRGISRGVHRSGI
jgi:hypothetical protein